MVNQMTKAKREAQQLAYQALQEALDRRDNGGRSVPLAQTRTATGQDNTPVHSASRPAR